MGDPAQQQVNYDALAQQHGGSVATQVDYDALAQQHGGAPTGPSAEDARAVLAAQQRAGLEASGAIPKSHPTNFSNTPPGVQTAMTAPLPKPIEYGIRATPYLSGVESVPALINAARVAAGGYIGGKVARTVTAGVGGGDTAQNAAEVGGSILGGGAAGTGLGTALLKSPTKALAMKAGESELLSAFAPKIAKTFSVLGKVADALPDNASAATHPATAAAIKDALDTLHPASASGPSAILHDIPSLEVQSGPQAPVNLLDAAKPGIAGAQGEFEVVPPEAQTPAPRPSPSNAHDQHMASLIDDAIAQLKEDQAAKPPVSDLYGKTPTRSNLAKNQRQLASATGSTAPVPEQSTPVYKPSNMGSMKNYFVKPAPEGVEVVSGEGGGHAGNGVTSLEELNRPGTNFVVSKSNGVTYQGKAFDPGSTPPGGTHVTVLPNGQFRVNSGTLTPAQGIALKRTLFELARQ